MSTDYRSAMDTAMSMFGQVAIYRAIAEQANNEELDPDKLLRRSQEDMLEMMKKHLAARPEAGA